MRKSDSEHQIGFETFLKHSYSQLEDFQPCYLPFIVSRRSPGVSRHPPPAGQHQGGPRRLLLLPGGGQPQTRARELDL